MNTDTPVYEVREKINLTRQSQLLAEHAGITVYDIIPLAEDIATAEKDRFSLEIDKVQKNAKRYAAYAIMCFEMVTHGEVAFPVLDVPILEAKEGRGLAIPRETTYEVGCDETNTPEFLYESGTIATGCYLELTGREKTLLDNTEFVQGALQRKKYLQKSFEEARKLPAGTERRAAIRKILDGN